MRRPFGPSSATAARPARIQSDFLSTIRAYHTVWYGHMKDVTVIGGGLGGLAAAITAAEGGASVTLHESHRSLGGRWRSTPVRRKADANPSEASRQYQAHEGPHVIYRDGPTWAWLKERGLLGVTCRVPVSAVTRFRSGPEEGCGGGLPVGFSGAWHYSGRLDVPVDRS